MRVKTHYLPIVFLIVAAVAGCNRAKEDTMNWQQKADAFLTSYLQEYGTKEATQNLSYWKAANSGKAEDFDAYSRDSLALNRMHNDKTHYQEIQELLNHKEELTPLAVRCLARAELEFQANQMPPDLMEQIIKTSAGIEQVFTAFRGTIDGAEYSDNQLIEMMGKETDTAKRRKIWEAMKQVGGAVAADLVKLAGLRNQAAHHLGFKNFWDMKVRLEEHNPDELMAIFSELESLTDEPFKKMKSKLDGELAKRLGIEAKDMMPWHYDNPFFQAPPPSEKIDMDEFYRGKKEEEIVGIAKKYFADLGLGIEPILKNSDLYERPGKNQHAFSTDINRNRDVRILMNLKPTAENTDTLLHELGHATYSYYADYSLPYNVRDAAHAFTTEGVAMFFGALAKTPSWLMAYGGADPARVKELEAAIMEQRQREQLLFARWSLVMFYFEKAMYEDPSQDLNRKWWEYVARFQMLNVPEDRNAPDWASKIHFTIVPVYYHNYQLGELFAAQLRGTLKNIAMENYGAFFRDKVFAPGMKFPWPQFVKEATGEPLTAKYFAGELK